MKPTPTDTEVLLELSQQLLDTIAIGDWGGYAAMCDPTLTCFEPEAPNALVEGLPFHQYYFQLPKPAHPTAVRNTLSSPKVRIIGDVAIVTYVRLTQKLVEGAPRTGQTMETRIWQRHAATWKLVHIHRS